MSEAACGFHHDGTGCKIRHGIGLQQVGPKPLIQATVTGKCAKLNLTRPLSLPHQHSVLIRLVYGYVLAVILGRFGYYLVYLTTRVRVVNLGPGNPGTR